VQIIIDDQVVLYDSSFIVNKRPPLPFKEVCKLFALKMLLVDVLAFVIVKIQGEDQDK